MEVWYTKRTSKLVDVGEVKSGFHIGPSDTFSMQVDLVSYADKTKDIFLTMELEFLEGSVGKDAQETLLDISSCGGQGVKISEQGSTNSTSGKMVFTESGVVIGAKGHLHVSLTSFFFLLVSGLLCLLM